MAAFFMDSRVSMDYLTYMLNGICVYTADNTWRAILGGMGAVLADAPGPMVVDFDCLGVTEKISPIELKAILLNAVDNTQIVQRVLGNGVVLPRLQEKIVTLLYKTGGTGAAEIKKALGYSPDAATHTVDTAIYQLRRAYGRDFIINDNGIYRLGKL